MLTLTKLFCCFNHLKTDSSAVVEKFNMMENEVKNGEVVWYNERKGYGFVKLIVLKFFSTVRP